MGNAFQDAINKFNKEILNSCDQLEEKTLPRLSAIIKEKINSKKNLVDQIKLQDENLKCLQKNTLKAAGNYENLVSKLNLIKSTFKSKLNLTNFSFSRVSFKISLQNSKR